MSPDTPAQIAAATQAHVLLARLRWEALQDLAAASRPVPEPDELQRRWRTARSRMHELASRERGCADNAAVLPLPPEMGEHVARVAATPALSAAFSRVPVAFGLVEIDALVAVRACLWQDTLAVYAQSVDEVLRDDRALAAFTLPLQRPAPAVRTRFDGQRWQVTADDEALAVLRATASLDETGCARLELIAGSPPPLMHAARIEGRLLLLDGAHRARSLRARGVSFAPCLISACDGIDDLQALCPWMPASELQELVDSPRPPMLRDHDRRSLVMRMPAARRSRTLTVDLSRWSDWLPA